MRKKPQPERNQDMKTIGQTLRKVPGAPLYCGMSVIYRKRNTINTKTTKTVQCDNCGISIGPGAEFLFDDTDGVIFCNAACMKGFVEDHD